MGGIIITKSEGGIGRREPSEDMVSGLLCNGVMATGLNVGVTSDRLNSIADVEALGITAIFDSANSFLVWYHCAEFFRMNPNGSLYIRMIDRAAGLGMQDLVFSEIGPMMVDSKGSIRQIAVASNPELPYLPSLANGLDEDAFDSIEIAQAAADAQFALKRPLQILIEGREFNGTIGAAADLRELASPNVNLVILQDSAKAVEKAEYAKHAAVGTMLGVVSAAKVHESIGWTAKFDIADSSTGAFVDPNFSDGASASSREADYANFTAKAFCFGKNYPGQSGTYFDAFPTCTLISSDYAYGQNERTIDKAVRAAYDALFPKINAPIKINPDNGQMEAATAKAYEADAIDGLTPMLNDDEVSGIDAFVDPAQNVQETGVVEIEISIVQVATGRTISVTIGFAANI